MRSVNDIMPMIGARFYTQLDAAQMRNDVIEEDLAKVKCVVKGVCTHLHLCVSVDVKQSNYCAGYSMQLAKTVCRYFCPNLVFSILISQVLWVFVLFFLLFMVLLQS